MTCRGSRAEQRGVQETGWMCCWRRERASQAGRHPSGKVGAQLLLTCKAPQCSTTEHASSLHLHTPHSKCHTRGRTTCAT